MRTYDVTPDGRRFMMIKEQQGDSPATPPPSIVVVNWFQELKARAPAPR